MMIVLDLKSIFSPKPLAVTATCLLHPVKSLACCSSDATDAAASTASAEFCCVTVCFETGKFNFIVIHIGLYAYGKYYD